MNKTKIEWTDATWNPVTGCTRISPGCEHCYAERLAKRLKAMGNPNYEHCFEVTLHPHMLSRPAEWKRPQNIFVNSMSDLFHQAVPDEFILEVFKVMNAAHWHRFQVLTKRADRLLEISSRLPWTNNIWMGVSIENEAYLSRAKCLTQTDAAVKFVSLEPLLGPVHNIDLAGIDWVIVGGESGPGARHMSPDWVIEIRDQCSRTHIPFFFKQWGGTNKKKAGRILEGQLWDEMPSGSAEL